MSGFLPLLSSVPTGGWHRPGARRCPAEDGCRWRWRRLFQAFLELNPVTSHLAVWPPQQPEGCIMQLHCPVKERFSAWHVSKLYHGSSLNNIHITLVSGVRQNTKVQNLVCTGIKYSNIICSLFFISEWWTCYYSLKRWKRFKSSPLI